MELPCKGNNEKGVKVILGVRTGVPGSNAGPASYIYREISAEYNLAIRTMRRGPPLQEAPSVVTKQ